MTTSTASIYQDLRDTMERTLVLIKPDAFQRGLIGRIIARFEEKGLKLVGAKLVQMTSDMLDEHYNHLSGQHFYPDIQAFMSSTPVLALCWEGFEDVSTIRCLCGDTNARNARLGTIRGDFAMSIQCNLVHASESPEAAAIEIERFFNDEELFDYSWHPLVSIYSPEERDEN